MIGSASAPLAGLRVLDFGQYIAGPMAAVFLADQGADVIAIDPPGGAVWEHPAAATLARGKRRVELDLHTADGVDTALRLIDEADVLIENFRPGVMNRLGLGYDVLAQRNPGLVVVSLPGYSRHDHRSSTRGWDSVISAACGLYTNLSTVGSVLNLPPVFTALPIPSVYAAVHGAIAAVAGVYGRDFNGHGDWIEVPLLDAAMSAAAAYLLRVTDQPKRYNEPPLPSALLDRLNFCWMPRGLSRALEVRARALFPPFFRNYRAKDGRLLFLCAIDHKNHIDRVVSALELDESVESLGFTRGDVLDIPATKTNIYAYRSHPRWNRLTAAIQKRIGRRSAADVENTLATQGVPVGMQRTTAEWTSMPEMRAAGVVVVTDDAVQPGLQIDLKGTTESDARVVATRPTSSGTSALTGTIEWWSPEQPFAMTPTGSAGPASVAPLTGVAVLDMANVIAGPVAARTLAELGATVTHVDPVVPMMGPRLLLHIGLEVNQGKRSIAMDPTKPSGREVLEELVGTSDVVLYNKTAPQARRLGVAPEDIHRLNDEAVVCAITAWGGPRSGGWEDRPGYDPVVQAVTGVMSRFGGVDHPTVHGVAATIDYFTGFSGAYAAIVGLLARRRGGRNLTGRTSLVRSAGWVQLPFVTGHDVVEPSGHATTGWHATDRFYKARGGWIYVYATPSAGASVTAGLRRHDPTIAEVTWSEAGRTLETVFSKRSIEDALEIALGAGFAAHQVVDVRAMVRRARPGRFDGTPITPDLPSGRVLLAEHPSGTSVVLPDSTWNRPLRSPRRRLTSTPAPGADTDGLLATSRGPVYAGSSAFSTGWFTAAGGYLPE
ncbi:CoA transferase [Rhodococcoides fascians]|uniref:CoA transferase n=1 Tax=Rhodococcoides fascians TaxID=1828 RepID=UPI000568BC95|nr:CoA transferase [Rhodococcus fascians]